MSEANLLKQQQGTVKIGDCDKKNHDDSSTGSTNESAAATTITATTTIPTCTTSINNNTVDIPTTATVVTAEDTKTGTEQQQKQPQEPAIKFVPFNSRIESAFWVRYCRTKLDRIRLQETPIPIRLTYGVTAAATTTATGISATATATKTMSIPFMQCHDHSLLLGSPQEESEVTTVEQESRNGNTNTNDEYWTNNECVHVTGHLIGYNTLETFQTIDKNTLLLNYFLQRFFPTTTTTSNEDSNNNVPDDEDEQIVQALNCAVIISYADLKNHTIVYWFGFPVFLLPPQKSLLVTQVPTTDDDHNDEFWIQVHNQFDQMRHEQLLSNHPNSYRNTSNKNHSRSGGYIPYFIYCRKTKACRPLSIQTYQAMLAISSVHDLYFGYFDPVLQDNTDATSSNESNNHNVLYLGWPIRNLIAYLSFYCQLGNQNVHIISYRQKVIRRIDSVQSVATTTMEENRRRTSTTTIDNQYSIVLKVRIPTKEEYVWTTNTKSGNSSPSTSTNATAAITTKTETILPQYKIVGWELNARYKPGPRMVNLRPLLDTNHLAIQAADLNLKLMKWRMIPDLQVDTLQSTKVLLIGAGTLGCNVARILLGWGIRNIKIIDYGKVSYSNPVRQSLFTLSDCYAENGSGRMKAIAAAEALQSITPDVVSEGIVLSIPMPGHPDKVEIVNNAVNVLDALIQEVDVVYLLTDTRESRWLPTVMCTAYNKILINAALGLDSWLVMRHGPSPLHNNNQERLGCYFCSDVVAPENSMKNRTLDQQCTVTRPGLAYIASSMAVELMVSLLHHPKQIMAPAPKHTSATNSSGGSSINHNSTQFSPVLNTNDDNVLAASSTLGIIPHSIRGSLVTYTMMTPTIPSFQYCTGCSSNIIETYLHDKYQFVQQCCETTDGSYLEGVSGLTSYRIDAAEKMVDVDGWEDDE